MIHYIRESHANVRAKHKWRLSILITDPKLSLRGNLTINRRFNSTYLRHNLAMSRFYYEESSLNYRGTVPKLTKVMKIHFRKVKNYVGKAYLLIVVGLYFVFDKLKVKFWSSDFLMSANSHANRGARPLLT